MNREQVYVEFRKKVESDDNYFIWGKTGLIEETLAYFGLTSVPFRSVSSCAHEDNLQTLHHFMKNDASDEQIELIYEIATGRKSVPYSNPLNNASGRVFVSMPMNKHLYDCVDDVRKGVSLAIEDTGNVPYFLDLDAHNDNIYEKMLLEIRSCKFLVADFTYQNQGVYYEAGYAKALGKTVIHTCKHDEFPNLHFDIKQIQCVIWNNTDDLQYKLKEQIEKSGLGVK